MEKNQIISEVYQLMNPEHFRKYEAGYTSELHAPVVHEITFSVRLSNGGVLINLDYDEDGFSHEVVPVFANELTLLDEKEIQDVTNYFDELIDKEKMAELFSKL